MPVVPGESMELPIVVSRRSDDFDGDSDLVALKISLLGDCDIGKTTFMIKYVGDEEQTGLHMSGLNLMDKIFSVKGARIAFRIWDIKGPRSTIPDHMPIACKDAAAILIMFDLTSRCTLNSAIGWYNQARKLNKAAIPVLIGTKFDDFVGLPVDMQLTIVNEGLREGHEGGALLLERHHNINVNKIFKFVASRHFNLPWALQRNLTLGEPIIDF
ncbi:unnamed protein product [Spirodela intermedia]|uniref:Uncharacterized protein n=1 Tax=Spirodela intermedia TaxID=51605 RepID=A0A7I8JP65_SPIIN|nr:unnamed protein product [Spirodela intermedia]CAA6671964.1 unnamed protein product [Spirodela intermedia]